MSDNPIIEFLSTRRSVLAAKMTEPAPSADDLKRILEVAIRVPDHGKIEPWRIQVSRASGEILDVEPLGD